jgi:NADH-quinone oxidoreductase subunit J
MLLGVDREEDISREPLPGQRLLALVLGPLVIFEILLLAGSQWVSGASSSTGPLSGEASNVEKLARAIFTRYLLPFEATSVLLVIAVIGAVVLARRSEPQPEPESVEASAEASP